MARVEDRWIRKKDKTRTPQYGKGMRWRVVWEEPGGGLRKKSFPNKDAASAYAVKVQSEIHRGEYHSAAVNGVTLREWAETWFAAQVHQTDSSREQIRRRLDRTILPTLGAYKLAELGRAEIQAAVTDWATSLAPSTVKLTYTYLVGMLRAAKADKKIRDLPTAGVNLPKLDNARIRPLDVQQVQDLVRVISPGYREAVVFAAATGLRPSELFGLTWDRVDLDAGLVTVDRQLIRKGPSGPVLGPLKTQASYRSVKIGAASILMLKSRPDREPTELVFKNAVGGACLRHTRSTAWQKARQVLPNIGDGWHQLRHHHASLLISAGLSPVAVAHRLGHKDATETLKTYAHLWATDDDRMVAASDGLIVLDAV